MNRPTAKTWGGFVVPLLLAVALGAVACGNGSPRHDRTPPITPSTTTASPTVTTTGNPAPPGKLGTVKPGPFTSFHCTPGFRCREFVVTCPGVQDPARAMLEQQQPQGSPRGVVLYFSGETGQRPWVDPSAAPQTVGFMRSVAKAGLMNVMVAWEDPWLVSAPGEEAGPARLACRAASLIRYVHDSLFEPLGVHPAPETCGFCVAGESGGAGEVAYALSRYGLARDIDAAVMSGGMPFASIEKGCLKTTTPYWYGPTAAAFVDAGYGFSPSQRGPCASARASFKPRWVADSVNGPDAVLSYPSTRLEIIVGAEDASSAVPLGLDYIAALHAAGTPSLHVRTVPGLAHGLASDPGGLAAVREALLSG